MVIEINTDNLIQSGLTPNQFLISNLVYQRSFNTLENIRLHFPQIVKDELKELVDKEYVIETNNRIGYTITNKFLEYVVEADFFDQLLNTYPVHVIRNGNNKDYLRTDRDRCRRKYSRITRNKKSKHQHILDCLKYEIETRQNEGTMSFMKRLPNWLDSKEWESWAERKEDETTNTPNKIQYGTDLE